jgi:ankyrin repeat protein
MQHRLPALRFLLGGLGCLCCILLCTQCADKQDRAIQQLAAEGYSLSISEYLRAANEGKMKVLELMLKAGVNVNVRDAEGNCALNEAARLGHLSAVQFLLEQGAEPQSGLSGSLSAAVEGGQSEVLRALLNKKPNLADDAPALLEQAAAKGNRQVIASLLEALPKIKLSLEVLLAAAQSGDTGSVDLLLQAGASPWAAQAETGKTALMMAAAEGHASAVEMLLNAGSNRFALDHENMSALDHGAEHAAVVTLLTVAPTELERVVPSAQTDAAAVPRLEGQTVACLSQVAQPSTALELVRTYERALPVVAERMDSTYLILQDGKLVALGEVLPNTEWTLSELRSRPHAPAWWQQEAVLFHHATGRRHLMLCKLPVRCGAVCAELRSTYLQQRYEGQVADIFQLTDLQQRWKMSAILADRVIVQDTTGQSSSIRWPGRRNDVR